MIFAPIPPFHWIVTACAVVTVAALLLRVAKLGAGWPTRLAVLGLSALAAGLLTLAAWNPKTVRSADPQPAHLAIVLDVSESVQRTAGGWPTVREQVAALVANSVATLDPAITAQGTASIVTFQQSDRIVVEEVGLESLVASVQRLEAQDFAAGSGSDIAAGLRRGLTLLEQSSGRGAMLLVTDGNETDGDALVAAADIAQRGIPIYVLPVASDEPELAISSANLPTATDADSATTLRTLLQNRQPNSVDAEFVVTKNVGDESGQFGVSEVTSAPLRIDSDGKQLLNAPVIFEGVGLQFVDVELSSTATQHQRRFFIHVNEPAKLLAVGGNFDWTGAMSPEKAEVTRMQVGDFSAETDLTPYDGLILSGLPSDQFDTAALAHIAQTVEQDGLGLMVINGDHGGASEETRTILHSYEETEIAELLPIGLEPRPFTPEPPPRHLFIVIDTSGSMGAWQLQKAKEIANYLIDAYLRPEDVLDVFNFTTGAGHIVQTTQMNDAGKRQAKAAINNLGAGGGTNPQAVMDAIAAMNPSNCGLFFLSDGEFSAINTNSFCQAVAFQTSDSPVGNNDPIRRIADTYNAPQNFNPATIEIPYFTPEPRDKFFEEGLYPPVARTSPLLRDRALLPEGFDLDGTAVTYIKEEADLMVVRPKFLDPILAYKAHGNGYVGAVMTGFTDQWLASAETQTAIEDWMLRIVPYVARERYEFKLSDNGSTILLTISVRSQDEQLVRVSGMTVQVVLPDGTEVAVPMVADTFSPATFTGVIDVSRTQEAQPITLRIGEAGIDALGRPQAVPMLLPPTGQITAGQTDEANSYGLNSGLLDAIAESSGGRVIDSDGFPFFRTSLDALDERVYWHWLLVLAAFAYLGAILLRRLEGG